MIRPLRLRKVVEVRFLKKKTYERSRLSSCLYPSSCRRCCPESMVVVSEFKTINSATHPQHKSLENHSLHTAPHHIEDETTTLERYQSWPCPVDEQGLTCSTKKRRLFLIRHAHMHSTNAPNPALSSSLSRKQNQNSERPNAPPSTKFPTSLPLAGRKGSSIDSETTQ